MCQAHTSRFLQRPEHSYNWSLSRLSLQQLQSISSQAYKVYTNHSNRDTYSFAIKKYTNDFADQHVPCLYTIHSNGLRPHNCPPVVVTFLLTKARRCGELPPWRSILMQLINRSASRKTLRLVWKKKVHYRVYRYSRTQKKIIVKLQAFLA